MLSETMLKHLNDQVAAELYSAYLYLGLSYDLKKMGLLGFGHWLKCQYHEENAHAMKIADFIVQRDSEVQFSDVVAAKIEWECPCEAMKAAMDHEKLVTQRVNDVIKAARAESDFDTEMLMSWFIAEQHEEEATLMDIIKKLEMIGEDNNGLIWMDKKLGEREGKY